MSAPNTDLAVSTYRATLTHPLLSGPFVADLIATTPDRAASHVRMVAVHLYRQVELLGADIDVQCLHAGTCRDAGHDRGRCGE